MKKEKYVFYASIGYANADRKEVVEIEFTGDESEKEKEKIIQEYYDDWLNNFSDFTWWKVE